MQRNPVKPKQSHFNFADSVLDLQAAHQDAEITKSWTRRLQNPLIHTPHPNTPMTTSAPASAPSTGASLDCPGAVMHGIMAGGLRTTQVKARVDLLETILDINSREQTNGVSTGNPKMEKKCNLKLESAPASPLVDKLRRIKKGDTKKEEK